MPRALRLFLFLGLGLGACMPREEAVQGQFASLDRFAAAPGVSLDRAAISERTGSRPGARALVAFPSWLGDIKGVRDERSEDGFVQTITLGPKGRRTDERGDQVIVRVGSAPDPQAFPPKPTEAGIGAELIEQFPDLAMRVVTRPARNAYGPYGLAVGRGADGVRCLYAWQWLDGGDADRLWRGATGVSLRIRLCRARESLDALASAVDRVRLGPDHAAAAGRSEAAAPTSPRRDRVVPPARRAEAVAPRAAPPVATDPQGRVYLAAPPGAASAARRPNQGSSPPALGGSGPPLVPVGMAAPVVRPRGASPDLPLEALRGPAASAAPRPGSPAPRAPASAPSP